MYKSTRSKSGDVYRMPMINDFFVLPDTVALNTLEDEHDDNITIYLMHDDESSASVQIVVYKKPVEIKTIMNTSEYYEIPGAKTKLKIAIEAIYQRKGAKKLVRKMMCNLLAYIYNSTDVVKTDTIGLWACGDGPTKESGAKHLLEMYERMGFEICAVGKKTVYEKILNNEDLTDDEGDFDCVFGMSQDVGSLLDWCEHTLK